MATQNLVDGKASSEKLNITAEGLATVPEAMRFLALGRATVYKLMDSGELSYCKLGSARRLPWKGLREYAQRCLVG